jgi:hypothetical protein
MLPRPLHPDLVEYVISQTECPSEEPDASGIGLFRY